MRNSATQGRPRDEIARTQVIGAINDQVCPAENFTGIVAVKIGVDDGDGNLRIQRADSSPRRIYFCCPDCLGGGNDLPV